MTDAEDKHWRDSEESESDDQLSGDNARITCEETSEKLTPDLDVKSPSSPVAPPYSPFTPP